MVAQPRRVGAGPLDRLVKAIERERLIVVLRRVEPRSRLLALVAELAAAGARIFEVTFDGADAAGDLAACRGVLEAGGIAPDAIVGAGTIRDEADVARASEAGAAFAVSPILDPAVLAEAERLGLPFIPGAFTPTEVDRAWRLGAAFVKLFPASALGPAFVRELRGPMPEVRLVVTGGVDATTAPGFLDAGARAVGIGSALVRASATERAALVAAIRATP